MHKGLPVALEVCFQKILGKEWLKGLLQADLCALASALYLVPSPKYI
jgi:hypothetical protein